MSTINFVRKITHRQDPIKILELDLVLIAPSNSMKLPKVQPGLEQGSPDLSILRAYNSSSAYVNEMKLVGNEICPISFNMI